MKIDVHTHIFPDKIAAEVVEKLQHKATEELNAAGNGTMSDLIRQMHSAGIDKSVICPIATKPEQFESILAFSKSISGGKQGQAAKAKLIPFASVHPASSDCFSQLEKCAADGIRGIKLHPFYQNFNLGADHIIDIMRCCRDLDLVVLCHCGMDIGFLPERICTPEHILKVHEKVPGIKFIAAHLGGYRLWTEVVELLVGQPVYLDSAVLEADLHNDIVHRILKSHPADRLMLASDWPWCALDKARKLIDKLHRSEKDKALILGGNAKRLLDIQASF
ncbi:MAG: amidohydrolase family protein [Kiritimatiellia bacterium]